ncbi:MAG: hypothetical protein HYX34_06465 [Actinobacteria bacterium]|nr:hypothetical protein [Actinomycetota bacterium]
MISGRGVAVWCRMGTVAVLAGAGLLVAPAGAVPTASKASTASTASTASKAAPAAAPVDVLSYDLGDTAFRPAGLGAPVELRARVYAPRTIAERAPLVILLHGRHVTCSGPGPGDVSANWPCGPGEQEVPSYQGYDALGRALAARGAIVASIGANGINAADGAMADGGADARGQLVRRHLSLWKDWNTSGSGPFGDRFLGKVDLARVGLMGHSRGGEGVVAAAQQIRDTGEPYRIRAVVALAPVDFARRVLTGVPLQVVLPYCDGDVSDLQGQRYYDDSRYAATGDVAPKQTTLIYGANHNWFNTVWTTGPGSFDDAGWLGLDGSGDDTCGRGRPGRLTPYQQRIAGTAAMEPFLARFVLGDATAQAAVTGMVAPPDPVRWVVSWQEPDRLDVDRFTSPASARTNRLGGLAEIRRAAPALRCAPVQRVDIRPPPGQVLCRPDRPEGTGEISDAEVASIGWIGPGGAMVSESLGRDGVDVTRYDGLRFRVGVPVDPRNLRRAEQDLSVALIDADGRSAVVRAGEFTNALHRPVGSSVVHVGMGGVRIPLERFTGVDLTRVARIELRADRTPAGLLRIDDLAFTNERTGGLTAPTAGPVDTPPDVPGCSGARTAKTIWACAVLLGLFGHDSDSFVDVRDSRNDPGRRAATVDAIVRGDEVTRRRLTEVALHLSERRPAPDLLDLAARTTGAGRLEDGIVVLARSVLGSSMETATAAGTVEALYQGLVGREPDDGGRAYWTSRVDETGDAGPLAKALLASSEYATRLVDDLYRQYLQRLPNPSIRADWVRRITARSAGERDVVVHLVASEEFAVLVGG